MCILEELGIMILIVLTIRPTSGKNIVAPVKLRLITSPVHCRSLIAVYLSLQHLLTNNFVYIYIYTHTHLYVT